MKTLNWSSRQWYPWYFIWLLKIYHLNKQHHFLSCGIIIGIPSPRTHSNHHHSTLSFGITKITTTFLNPPLITTQHHQTPFPSITTNTRATRRLPYTPLPVVNFIKSYQVYINLHIGGGTPLFAYDLVPRSAGISLSLSHSLATVFYVLDCVGDLGMLCCIFLIV